MMEPATSNASRIWSPQHVWLIASYSMRFALRSGGGTLQKREQGAWRTSEQGLLIELSEGPALSARLVGGELLLRSERSAGSELEWVLLRLCASGGLRVGSRTKESRQLALQLQA